MTGQYIGYHDKNFYVNANIRILVPQSGFVFQFGRIGSWEGWPSAIGELGIDVPLPSGADPQTPFSLFTPVISFSGISGYIFDQYQNLIGGYLKDEPFDLEFNAFYNTGQRNRMSYKINGTLIANNIPIPSGDVFIDSVVFEDYGDLNNLFFTMKQETGSPTVIAGFTGSYLIADGFYLAGS
jgi:hypothetical protein